MKTAVLNIKIDPKVKKEAQKVADELGFTLSAIINASLRNLARTKTISYSLLEPSELEILADAKNIKFFERSLGESKKNKSTPIESIL